jgi:hypothetical protein
MQAAEHLLLPAAGSIEEADARLAPLLDAAVLDGILAAVPDEWLTVPRERFVTYLLRRLEAPRPFGAGAEEARRAILESGAPRVGRARDAARADA